MIYQTENLKNNLNPQFKEFTINLGKLSGGDMKAPIKVELWDFYENGSHDYMGEFTFTVE